MMVAFGSRHRGCAELQRKMPRLTSMTSQRQKGAYNGQGNTGTYRVEGAPER